MRNFLGQGEEGLWSQGPLIKIPLKTLEKEGSQGKILEVFLLDSFKTTF